MNRLFAVILVMLLAACASFRLVDAPDSILLMATSENTCTAWTVAPARWITAAHCIVNGVGTWRMGGGGVQPLVVDQASDIALLSGPLGRALTVSDVPPPLGAPVRTFGYGLNRPALLFFDARVVSNGSTFFDNDASPQLLVSGANGMPGMSGGPILWRGKVVSQITGGGPAPSPAHLVGSGVPWATLRQFVRVHLGH